VELLEILRPVDAGMVGQTLLGVPLDRIHYATLECLST
jgi:hypothetical protein